jgi:hypothetical protein
VHAAEFGGGMELVMHGSIQFETIVESGLIRIPKHYIETIPAAVKVTLAPINEPRVRPGAKSGAGTLSFDDFSAFKIDTRAWKFNREEANERR